MSLCIQGITSILPKARTKERNNTRKVVVDFFNYFILATSKHQASTGKIKLIQYAYNGSLVLIISINFYHLCPSLYVGCMYLLKHCEQNVVTFTKTYQPKIIWCYTIRIEMSRCQNKTNKVFYAEQLSFFVYALL